MCEQLCLHCRHSSFVRHKALSDIINIIWIVSFHPTTIAAAPCRHWQHWLRVCVCVLVQLVVDWTAPRRPPPFYQAGWLDTTHAGIGGVCVHGTRVKVGILPASVLLLIYKSDDNSAATVRRRASCAGF